MSRVFSWGISEELIPEFIEAPSGGYVSSNPCSRVKGSEFSQESDYEAVVTENLVCMLTLSAGELINATVQQRCNGILDRKAGSAEKNLAWLATRLLWFIKRTETVVAEDRLILSGVALVSVMKSSDQRNHYDAPTFWLLHGPRFRSIFGQRQMSSGVVIVGKITST